ncbi:hypothetical protein DFR52_105246 [Hoeflea marina]|uniref:UPF0235 protein DFR52_105246 n=1 Tax=Hoeflea marina TaxID=274592 RepID=A0A317PEF1_9HYPH|nr:DUF167 family protein [Hoeflea marina]PWV98265.1 hypothetical protein DFR52_105246 [Hoeflea marina]
MSDWLRLGKGRVLVELRLTPGAGADGFAGLAGDADGNRHLRARVTAIAEKSKANKAVIALLSSRLRVAKSSISIVSGPTSRIKSIEILGDPDALAARLREIAAQA